MSITQSLFRFCACFEFDALPISETLRPFQREAETTDDLEVKAQRQREVSHKTHLSNSVGGPSLCWAEESQWLPVARLWASSLAMRAHLSLRKGLWKQKGGGRKKPHTLVSYRFSPKLSWPNAFYLPNTGNGKLTSINILCPYISR